MADSLYYLHHEVLFRGTHWIHFWSLLQKEEDRPLIKDACRRPETAVLQTRTWIKHVREVGYDAEDCIDIFCYHLSKYTGDGRDLARHLNKIVTLLRTLKVRNNLATNIQSLKSRAQKVSDRRLRYKLDAAETKHPLKGNTLN